MATATPSEGPTPRSAQMFHRMTFVLAAISVVLIAIGVFTVYAYYQSRDTQDCLVQVAAQGGSARDAAVVLWVGEDEQADNDGGVRALIAAPQGSDQQSQATLLAQIDRYVRQLKAANVNAECLADVDVEQP